MSTTHPDYTYGPTREYPLAYTYTATMQRDAVIELSQDGTFFCDSIENAEAVVAYWNFISGLHRTSDSGNISWNYKLKGQG